MVFEPPADRQAMAARRLPTLVSLALVVTGMSVLRGQVPSPRW